MIRIIPRLDIKSSNLVKGIHLEGLRVLGKPEDFARHYFENGADELFDQEATGAGFDVEPVRGIAEAASIPVIAGGVEHVVEVADAQWAAAVCVASMPHDEYLESRKPVVDCDKLSAGNKEFLRKRKSSFRKSGKASPAELKGALRRAGSECREEYEAAAG